MPNVVVIVFPAGIGGEKCDECAPGFVQARPLSADHKVLTRKIPYGESPQCVECGECFSNWERILLELRKQTDRQMNQAETVKVTGVAGAYTRSFEDMEGKLEKVRSILRSASISNEELIGEREGNQSQVSFFFKISLFCQVSRLRSTA